MAQEKRPWWSVNLWGGKKKPPPHMKKKSDHEGMFWDGFQWHPVAETVLKAETGLKLKSF